MPFFCISMFLCCKPFFHTFLCCKPFFHTFLCCKPFFHTFFVLQTFFSHFFVLQTIFSHFFVLQTFFSHFFVLQTFFSHFFCAANLFFTLFFLYRHLKQVCSTKSLKCRKKAFLLFYVKTRTKAGNFKICLPNVSLGSTLGTNQKRFWK